MKICGGCNLEKSFSEFPPNSSKKDGLNRLCRECYNNYQKSWYKKNSSLHKSRTRKVKKQQIVSARNFVINFLKENPCVICGEDDIVVLEFDHTNPENKEFSISRMISSGMSILRIQKEISKCQVMCANCHRRKTANQFSWYKIK